MTTAEIIQTLERRGGRLVVRGSIVSLRGPTEVTTPEIVAELQRRQDDITEVLKARDFGCYLDILKHHEGDSLPPVPPAWTADSPEYNRQAWAAWWTIVDAQARCGHE